MSISNLFVPNDYDLYCRTLTASSGVVVPGDVPLTTISNVSLFNGTSPSGGNIWKTGFTVKFDVISNVCRVWLASSSGGFGNGKTGTPSALKLGPLDTDPVNGYFPVGSLPIADSGDGNFYQAYPLIVNNVATLGRLGFDTNVGTDSNQTSITIQLLGADVFNNGADNNNMLNFFFQYPIKRS